jgi:ketosteroid isomerase-like protein
VPQKFMNTWRKQQDGSWKVSASMSTVKNGV